MSLNIDSEHQRLLAGYHPLCDAISALFYPYVEVVIHDLLTQKVSYLANNISRREIGDDSALENIEFTESENVIGPYEKLNWDGRKMRAISSVIRSPLTGQPEALLCINFNTYDFEQIRGALNIFLSGGQLIPQPEKLFRDDWQERINTFMHSWLQKQGLSLSTLSRAEKRLLVEALYAEGAFNGKSAANYVANIVGVSRASVFKYIKELKS